MAETVLVVGAADLHQLAQGKDPRLPLVFVVSEAFEPCARGRVHGGSGELAHVFALVPAQVPRQPSGEPRLDGADVDGHTREPFFQSLQEDGEEDDEDEDIFPYRVHTFSFSNVHTFFPSIHF